MTNYIIVWYDNDTKAFNNDYYYETISKTEAIKRFYYNHDNNAIIINIIEV